MTIRSLFFPLFALAFVASVPAVLATAETGHPAPDFALADLDGRTHHLSDYQGKVVVLEWNNPDCPIVHKHYDSGNLPRLQRAAEADGVIWLLINSSAPGNQGGDYSSAQLKAWLGQHNSSPTAYLRDADGRVGHLYGAKTTPHMFVINAAGTLVYDGAIDSIRSADPDDIPRAENYVAAALAAVKTGAPVARANTQPYGCSVKY